jgi:hypothetical protein
MGAELSFLEHSPPGSSCSRGAAEAGGPRRRFAVGASVGLGFSGPLELLTGGQTNLVLVRGIVKPLAYIRSDVRWARQEGETRKNPSVFEQTLKT